MKSTAKYATVLMTAFVATSLLAGCGSSNGNGNTSKTETGSTNQAPAPTEPATTTPDTTTSNKLVVYAALNEDDVIQIQKQFKADTGIEIEYLRPGSAGETSARVLAEKDAPQADIFVGGSVEFHQTLEDEGLLEKYTSPNAAAIEDRFKDPNGFWQGWYMGVLGIGLNTERFEKELASQGVKEPKTWDDLLDSHYKDVFVTSNPATAGGGYIFVADQLFRLGEDKGWDYLTKLNENVHHYTPAAGDGINLTATGEFVATMAWAHDIVKSAKTGMPIKVVIPEQTAFEIGGVSIVKGGPNVENAKKFVDWLLTKPVAEMNTAISNRYSVLKEVAAPEGMPKIEDINLVDYDRPKASEMKAAVVEKFTGIIGNK